MRSPPPSLRPLVDRLNRAPTRSSKVVASVKSEPKVTPSVVTLSLHSSQSSHSGHLIFAPHDQVISQNNTNSESAPSSTSTAASDHSVLSQALVNFLKPPTASSNTDPTLDFKGCRVEIHFHVHPAVRPVLPSPCPRTDRLKRKRDRSDVDQVADGDEGLERQVKKLKLSSEAEGGLRAREQGKVRRRSSRMNVADGVKARSRSGLRRMSSRGLDAGRIRK